MISPFAGISELQKNKLLKKLETHIYSYKKNEEILTTLKTKNIVCIMLEGNAKITSISYLGEETLIEELNPESVFGTNMTGIANLDYQITALEDSKILVIDHNKLLDEKHLNSNYYNIFLFNLFKIIDLKLRDNNNRISILTKKTIREKLLSFFENEFRNTHSQNIYLSTNFKDLADYLAINRSAMFRELKHLKEENFIKINGKRITLLYRPQI